MDIYEFCDDVINVCTFQSALQNANTMPVFKKREKTLQKTITYLVFSL